MSAIITLGRALWRVLLLYLICVSVLWHRKPELIPFLFLSTSLQQIPTVRASFLYKRTEQQHMKSLQSPKGAKQKKNTHAHTHTAKQTRKTPKPTHTLFSSALWCPLSRCNVNIAWQKCSSFHVHRGCAIQHWGHLPAPKHVFNARTQNTISCARFTSASLCYSNRFAFFCIYRLILVFTIRWFNKIRSRALSRKTRAFVESYWRAFTNFSWTDKW